MPFPQWFHNERQWDTVKLVCDVIHTLFPVNETICTGIACYLCYGKSPWGFRFRFLAKGICQLIILGPWGAGTEELTVIKELGLQNSPRLGSTDTLLPTVTGCPGPAATSLQHHQIDTYSVSAEGTWTCPA